MATKEAIIKELTKLEAVLQDKKLGDLTLALYQKALLHFPEEVLARAVAELIKTCRYFPTIAEILAVADPILQDYNLKRLRQIEEDRLNECRKFVYYDFATNRVYCRAQPEDSCECARTGDRSKCRMWELLDELRRKDWIENNRAAGQAPAGAPEQQEGSHADQR
ncbi:MAG: hypothetical protein A4E67_02202 [Syntrophaceae bacterium PtaB.Bin038]|nr:MAG: hypothetical protein A4E67_02202 [Syntrophaceae bacterium PtaB.Bin038]